MELPQLTDLRILKVRRSRVQTECGGPGLPISEQKAVMEGLWLIQLSGTSAAHPSTSHHTLRAEKLYSLSLRRCPALVPVTPPVRWWRM